MNNFYQYKMTQYNSLNMKLSNSQLNKLKSAIEDGIKAVLTLSSNMIGDSDDKINFWHEILLTNKQLSNLHKVFSDKSSTDIKLSITQVSKMIQSGGFHGRLLGPLLKTGLSLIKNVIKRLAKRVLIRLGLTAAPSVADAGIHKKILRPGNTTLMISNDEMKDIIRIVKSLEDSGLLLKGVSETIQNEAKEQKGGFLSMLLGTLGASLLGNILAGQGINKFGEGVIRAGYGNKRQDHKNKMDF